MTVSGSITIDTTTQQYITQMVGMRKEYIVTAALLQKECQINERLDYIRRMRERAEWFAQPRYWRHKVTK